MLKLIFNVAPNTFFLNLNIQDPATGLANRFVIIIIAVIIALISRYILMKSMNRLMMSKSKKLDNSNIEDLQFPESENKLNVKFTILDSNSDFSNTSSKREKMVSLAKQSMFQQLKLDLLIVLVYAVVSLIIYSEFLLDGLQYFLYLTLFFIWVIMRFVGFRHQFKAYQQGVFGFISPIWKKIFAIFQTRWYMLLAAIVILFTFGKALLAFLFGDIDDGIFWLIPVTFHIVTILRIRKKS